MRHVFTGEAAAACLRITAYLRLFQPFAASQLILRNPFFDKRQLAVHALNQHSRIERPI